MGNIFVKTELIPHKTTVWHQTGVKAAMRFEMVLCPISSDTLELRHGPDSYGRQQWGILDNGGNPDPATPREGRRSSDCKLLLEGTNKLTVPSEKATANYVPAAAVIRRWRALFGITRRKAYVGDYTSLW